MGDKARVQSRKKLSRQGRFRIAKFDEVAGYCLSLTRALQGGSRAAMSHVEQTRAEKLTVRTEINYFLGIGNFAETAGRHQRQRSYFLEATNGQSVGRLP